MDTDKLEAMLARGQESAMLRYTPGNTYAKARDWSTAETHFAAAVALDPQYSAAWQGLFRARQRGGTGPEVLRETAASGLEAARAQGDMQVVRSLEAQLRKLG